MNPGFAPEVEAFRAEVRAFLEGWRGLDGFFHQDRRWSEVRAFYEALGARGWLALSWPEEAGGAARPPVYDFVLWDEAARARVARPPLSAGVVAKTLLRHGTADQRARLLPPIRAGRLHFSLGYSEPEAGSDLASVRTRAERSGDAYVVTGRKLWTSYARHSDRLWLLCRTGPQEARADGLTLLVVDLRAPGVTVRPLPVLDGETLNEVALDGVAVPAADRVGPEGGAWKLVGEALADERLVQFPPARVRRDLEDLVAWLRARGRTGDPHVRTVLAELAVAVREVEMHALRVLDALAHGRSGTAEAAANKVAHTVACQRVAGAALDLGGPEAVADGPLGFLWRQSTWETIGGGTSEVLRGVVARHALGLGARR